MARIFKHIFAVVFLMMSPHCGDLDRSNPLDPKNSSSEKKRTVLVEAFINESGGNVIEAAIAGYTRLSREFGSEQFLLLEHHIQKTQDSDSLALQASLSRYMTYVPQIAEQGIPDVFFDGILGRVQGASDAETAYLRYKAELERALNSRSKLTIEADATLETQNITIHAKIARLGREDATDLNIYTAIAEHIRHNRPVVRAFELVETVGTLKAGEIVDVKRKISFDSRALQVDPVIFIVAQNSRTLEIFHSAVAKAHE